MIRKISKPDKSTGKEANNSLKIINKRTNERANEETSKRAIEDMDERMKKGSKG